MSPSLSDFVSPFCNVKVCNGRGEPGCRFWNSIFLLFYLFFFFLSRELADFSDVASLVQGFDMEYYSILGVAADASDEEIRRAYRKLAMQWHPDKWTKTPSLLGEANQKFQQIQEAYSVLSDANKRMLYDSGLYDPDDEVEGFADFVQEMVCLMSDAKKEEKNYSIEELQSMFWEMAQDFGWNDSLQQPPLEQQWLCGHINPYGSGSNPWGASIIPDLNKSSFETFGAHHFCR